MPWLIREKTGEKRVIEHPWYTLRQAVTDIPWQRSSATKTLALMAFSLICAYDIETVVEIGVADGFSTDMLARALRTSSFYRDEMKLLVSIDNKQRCIDYIKEKNYSYIKHVPLCMKSTDLDFRNNFLFSEIGLSFIDGDHRYEVVKQDIENCASVTKKYGFILLHDHHPRSNSGVIQATKEFLEEKGKTWSKFYLPENKTTADYDSVILQFQGEENV